MDLTGKRFGRLTEKKMKKILRMVIDYYGADHQLSKAIEEQAELIHVIARRLQSKEWNVESFLEEFADVYVIFDQMKLIYCAETGADLHQLDNELDKRKCEKMKRTLRRIDKEND